MWRVTPLRSAALIARPTAVRILNRPALVVAHIFNVLTVEAPPSPQMGENAPAQPDWWCPLLRVLGRQGSAQAAVLKVNLIPG